MCPAGGHPRFASRSVPPGSGAQLRAEPESAVRADMGFRLRRATRAFSDFTFQLRLGLRVLCGGAGRAGTGAPASGVRWVKRYGFTAYSPSFHFRFRHRGPRRPDHARGPGPRSLSNSNPYLPYEELRDGPLVFRDFGFAHCSTFREPRYCHS